MTDPQAAIAVGRLEAELIVAKSNAAKNAELLLRLRDAISYIVTDFIDEGDRVYLGSTNHADELREVRDQIEALPWDKIAASFRYATISDVLAERQRHLDLLREAARMIGRLSLGFSEADILLTRINAVLSAEKENT